MFGWYTLLAFGLVNLLAGVVVTIAVTHWRTRKPIAYYQVSVGGQLWPLYMYSRPRVADKAKEIAQGVPGTPIEIWGFELIGRAMVSVSKPYHWPVGKQVKAHWPEIDIVDEQPKGSSDAVDSIPGVDTETKARSSDSIPGLAT